MKPTRQCGALLLAMVLVLSLGAAAPRQAGRPVDRFRQLDRDGDGRLSREEFSAPRLFDRLDADRDGFVTRQEEREARAARERMANRRRPRRPPLPEPDFADVRYGPHERNVFDLWQAKGEAPTPLVIYYHGGGFRAGDKRSLDPQLLKGLLEGGVSVAAANYRLTDAAAFPAPMHDAARALQFIRLHAADYGINPERIGATGGSAGAGISQWLAFHDDLADPDSADPLARQSTRLTCAAVRAAQSSYDPRFMQELFGATDVEAAMIPFYGMGGPEDVGNADLHPLFEEASPINHATADDPPVMLYYPQPNEPLPPDPPSRLYIHHPKFGFALKEKLDSLGVECVLKLREDYHGEAARTGPTADMVAFFVAKLGSTGR